VYQGVEVQVGKVE